MTKIYISKKNKLCRNRIKDTKTTIIKISKTTKKKKRQNQIK